jgi:hypothetical protein
MASKAKVAGTKRVCTPSAKAKEFSSSKAKKGKKRAEKEGSPTEDDVKIE